MDVAMFSIRPILFGFFITVFFVSTVAISQSKDSITVRHKYYSSDFSKSKHFQVVVNYWLTTAMLDCAPRFKRLKRFTPDPMVPEFSNLDKYYKKSCYDRGHQIDAYDCSCDSGAMAESF